MKHYDAFKSAPSPYVSVNTLIQPKKSQAPVAVVSSPNSGVIQRKKDPNKHNRKDLRFAKHHGLHSSGSTSDVNLREDRNPRNIPPTMVELRFFDSQNTSGGLNNSLNMSEGLDGSKNTSEGLNNSLNKSEGLDGSQNTSEGLNNSLNMSEGLDGSQNISEGLNNSLNMSEGLDGSKNTSEGLNNSLNKSEESVESQTTGEKVVEPQGTGKKVGESQSQNSDAENYDYYLMLENECDFSNDEDLMESLIKIAQYYGLTQKKYQFVIKEDLWDEKENEQARARTTKNLLVNNDNGNGNGCEFTMEINGGVFINDLKDYDGFTKVVATLRHEYKHMLNDMFSEENTSIDEAYDEALAYAEEILNEVGNQKAPKITKEHALHNYYQLIQNWQQLDGEKIYRPKIDAVVKKVEEKLERIWHISKQEMEDELIT